VGGHTEPGLRRAARIGDGWISVNTTAAQLTDAIRRLTELRAEYGRSEVPFEIDISPTDVSGVDGYRKMAEAGATVCRVVPRRIYDVAPTSQGRIDAVRRFADEVIAKF
jgi:hypothetical protein